MEKRYATRGLEYAVLESVTKHDRHAPPLVEESDDAKSPPNRPWDDEEAKVKKQKSHPEPSLFLYRGSHVPDQKKFKI